MSEVIQFYHTWIEHLIDQGCFHCQYKCLEDENLQCKRKSKREQNKTLQTKIMPWNNLPNHKRKFIKTKGTYVYKDNDQKLVSMTDDIAFWGELETETSFEEIKYTFKLSKDHLHNYPKFIHTPLMPENSTEKNLQNTDPYVFGDYFLYSCCLQAGFDVLQNLKKGDIILFGSRGRKDNKYYFALDTVFVVDKILATFNKKNYKNLLKNKIVSEHYFYSVIDKIFNGNKGSIDTIADDSDNQTGCINNEEPFEFHLYSAVSHKNPYNGMYSFFPCKKYVDNSEKSAFTRIDLPYKKFALSKPGKNTGIKQNNILLDFAKYNNLNSNSPYSLEKIYWDMLVDEVFINGCNLGVFAEEPKL